MSFPSNHQELFEAYYNAERSVISEFSGRIEEAFSDLNIECERYASENGLDFSFKIEPTE
jgi:hypothetical protein